MTLYFGTQYFLITPVGRDAQMNAQRHSHDWFMTSSYLAGCPSNLGDQPGQPGQGFQTLPQIACFDQNGNLLSDQNTPEPLTAFLNDTLVKNALQTGTHASDIVNVGGNTGQVYRYALVVPNASGTGYAGVVLVGESVQQQEAALSLLLILLLSLGSIALIGSGAGGLFLANRALAPTRLAWANQQRFIADASHELRTPLTLLRADAEVLLRGRQRLDPEDAALLEDIVTESNHMSTIAANLLTLARLDTRTIHREHEIVSLVALAKEGVRRVQALAEQHHIVVGIESSNDPYVVGDTTLLEQALLVLLDNAIKYNHTGGSITIHTAAQGGQALLEVSDTGIGIASEHLPHLGERFYRVDKARSREAGGTGLGLSIARSIAATHQGQLSLSSISKQGTTVTITLPLATITHHDQGRTTTETRLLQPEQTV
jgi:signal transduction histidine kinase